MQKNQNCTNTESKCGDASSKWNNFLTSLYNRLSEYEVQKNPTGSSCNNLANKVIEVEKSETYPINELKPLLEACYPQYEREFKDIQNMTLDKPKLTTLGKMLNLTIKYTLSDTWDSGKLTIKGQYVKLEEVQNIFKRNDTVKFIEVFALNTIFINTDLNMLGKEVQLSIVAPKWEIQGTRKIILDGAPGNAHDPLKAPNGKPSETSEQEGGRGQDGKPGLPGGPGGIFFGIGETFTNLENLTISVNGGQGGQGQDGGDGGNGKDGADAYNDLEYNYFSGTEATSNNHKIALYPIIHIHGRSSTLSHESQPYINGKYPHDFNIYASSAYHNYLLVGKDGSSGGNGGNGGKGGIGGDPGSIFIISLSPINVTVHREIHSGSNGVDGKGGKAGLGGKIGKCLHVKDDRSILGKKTETSIDIDIRASSGKEGASGTIAATELPKQKILSNSFDVVNSYKNYLRNNLNHSVREYHLLKFLNQLEDNNRAENQADRPDNPSFISDLYNATGFLNDLKQLESQYYDLHNVVSFLPFYQSLLKRAEVFIQKNQNNSNFKDHKALHYLCTAVLSRICNIKYDFENYQVVNIIEYFSILEKNIEKFNKALNEVVIDTYKQQYQNTVEAQILEARNVVDQSILPAISEIKNQIDNEMHSLIGNLLEQEKQADTDKKNLIQERNKLAQQLPLKALTSVLKSATSFLTLLGPEGAVAAAVSDLAIDSVEGLAFSDGTKADALIASVKTNSTELANSYEREQQLLKNIFDSEKINATEQELAEDGEFKEIVDKIETLNGSIRQASSTDENAYNNIKITTKTALTVYNDKLLKQKDELEKETKSTEAENNIRVQKLQKIESKLKKITRVQTGINIAEVGIDSLIDLKKNNTDVISALGDSIRLVEDKITTIKKYERDIINVFIPRIARNNEKLSGMLKNSSTKSHVVLDFDKWTMRKFLSEFRSELNVITEGSSDPSIKDKLTQCFDNLHDGIMTTLQVFDRIQDYQDQAKLATYIADLKTGTKLSENSDLSEEIGVLELSIKSNLLLQEYEKVRIAFKQYIFPSADQYLSQFNVSPFLKPNNLTDLVRIATKEMNTLKNVLTIENTSIASRKDLTFQNVRYDDKNTDQKPFFIWQNDAHKEEINKLLQGREIIMKADIRKGIRNNAIKFKEIGIRFKLGNEAAQHTLDKTLTNFLIKLTHMGDSHYRCNDQYYIFNHYVIHIAHHQIATNNTGNQPHYGHEDVASELIAKNKPIFSPYATWKMQLIESSAKSEATPSTNSSNFDELKQFVGQKIDLALEGIGGHVIYPSKSCNNLEKYYKLDNIISQSYRDDENKGTFNFRKRRQQGVINDYIDIRNGTNQIVSETTPFDSSSASINKSPINTAINFLCGILGQLSSFNVLDVVNHGFIKVAGVQSMFGGLKQFNVYTTRDYDNRISSATKFNVNESLTLVDFFIRWLTKMKPNYNAEENSTNSYEVRSSVLDIIVEFENLLNDVAIRYDLPAESTEFDPVVLMAELENETINGNYKNIGKILFQSIANNSHYSDNIQFYNYMRSKIDEIIIGVGK